MVYHSRMLVRAAAVAPGNTRWYIITPDDDAYEEDLLVGPDITQVFHLDSHTQQGHPRGTSMNSGGASGCMDCSLGG